MAKVFINKIDLTKSKIDYDKINSIYDFYLIENKRRNFKTSAKILDEPTLTPDVLAIQFTSGNSFIVMLKKNILNESRIVNIINAYNQENNDSLCKKKLSVPFSDYPHSLLQILFNALAKQYESISNITGKLFYFSEKKANQVYGLELKIDYSYSISLASKTFTKNKEEKKNRSYKKLFVLEPNNTLRIKTDNDKTSELYSLFQFKNTKHSISFANTKTPSLYSSSKTGILQKLVEEFNKEYSGIAELVLLQEDDWNKLDVKSSNAQKRDHLRHLKEILKGRTIRIIDKVGDKETFEFANELKLAIENIFLNKKYFLKDQNTVDFSITITDTTCNNDFNLIIIREKKYYEIHKEEHDLHEVSNSVAIQNITFESFPRDKITKLPSEAACIVLLNELIVKKDLICNNPVRQISIFNWKKMAYKNKWTFCVCDTEEIKESEDKTINVDHYYFMTINPDGSFLIGEKTRDMFNQKEYQKIQDIFQLNNMTLERHNRYDEKYKALVINESGDINIIQDTPNIMLPNIELISEDIKKEKLSRSLESLEKYYAGCLDIYYKKDTANNCEYYSSGQIGAGMQNVIERAARIRKVIPYESNVLFFKELLELMNVTFIRNGQLTVMPFPIKYLREYIQMQKSLNPS